MFVEEGTASWYGIPFHGRRAANGEIFDMNSLVAAHRTLPFGSILRVTNLNNGRDVQVRVIDRGPFVGDRILDLARAAAVSLDMIGTGTAPVRIELLSGPNPAVGDFTVQVGAFADRANAERLRDRLLAHYQPIFIQEYDAPAGHFYRVRVGRVPSPDAAQQLAVQLKNSDGFQTFVMRLDQPTILASSNTDFSLWGSQAAEPELESRSPCQEQTRRKCSQDVAPAKSTEAHRLKSVLQCAIAKKDFQLSTLNCKL